MSQQQQASSPPSNTDDHHNNTSTTDSASSSSESQQGIRIPANSLKDLLKSEYSQLTRDAIHKKFKEEASNLPFKARVEAKIQGFYGGDVGANAFNTLRKGVHEGTHKKGFTPLQKRFALLFGSFVLGQVFYFGGRYIFENFISSNKQSQILREQGNFYYGRDVNQFNSEVERLTTRMVGDYKKYSGSEEVTPEEYKMIERDALNRVSLKYAEQHEILGSSSQKPSSSKYIPR